MARRRFDVDDAELRESFLRHEVVQAVERLGQASVPRWGRMHPQEMIEHLLWAFELSTGEARIECPVPEAEWPRIKKFLYDNSPTPREFMNPALAAGLPPLRYRSLGEATKALAQELGGFLDGPRSDGQLYAHPIFGPIGYDGWHRTHYKHTYHHLVQFGLIEE
jgi:oxepin-CoA hydrolase / 3-oxo-5,6-dehydrosuberyl-CoA semialdehyde dehydrogenase